MMGWAGTIEISIKLFYSNFHKPTFPHLEKKNTFAQFIVFTL